jgi:beta-galactosidase
MTAQTMRLGVCYYPEHWPESLWADDACRMADMGLSRVRIGEFAWSRIETSRGVFDWAWLDRAIETLHAAGLGIIMGTPTATPPKWLVDAMPDMLARYAGGRVRGFGSRRHYCFSHAGYRAEAARIVGAMAERYGTHPAIVAWQTDNEYGCHDTAVSWSDAARDGFRTWLARGYANIAALNAAWGNVFWSMDYADFGAVELPCGTVTEANPAHLLAFRRFASDEVVAFNRMQADILRAASPGRDIIHNFMGFFTQFDHHAIGRDLDIATWDSYPLGFLEQYWFSAEDKATYVRQGHPDIAAFHHDLYRGCQRDGRWGVMEQQPGPVNWARYNPAPLPGMVRLWTLEAMAHGAEFVSYFRWRQFPQAQEQMHAGLLRPDSVDSDTVAEVRQVAAEIANIGALGAPPRHVALIFDYASDWVTEIQPQGHGFRALRRAFEWYSALRQLGLSIDIVARDTVLDGYAMVVAPCIPLADDTLVDRLAGFAGPVLVGARGGSKTADCAIPATLAPGALQRLIPIKVVKVETLRAPPDGDGVEQWIEHIDSDLTPEYRAAGGSGTVWRHRNYRYLAVNPDATLLRTVMTQMAAEAGLTTTLLGDGVRMRQAGRHMLVVNYAAEPRDPPSLTGAALQLGERALAPAAVQLWELSAD